MDIPTSKRFRKQYSDFEINLGKSMNISNTNESFIQKLPNNLFLTQNELNNIKDKAYNDNPIYTPENVASHIEPNSNVQYINNNNNVKTPIAVPYKNWEYQFHIDPEQLKLENEFGNLKEITLNTSIETSISQISELSNSGFNKFQNPLINNNNNLDGNITLAKDSRSISAQIYQPIENFNSKTNDKNTKSIFFSSNAQDKIPQEQYITFIPSQYNNNNNNTAVFNNLPINNNIQKNSLYSPIYLEVNTLDNKDNLVNNQKNIVNKNNHAMIIQEKINKDYFGEISTLNYNSAHVIDPNTPKKTELNYASESTISTSNMNKFYNKIFNHLIETKDQGINFIYISKSNVVSFQSILGRIHDYNSKFNQDVQSVNKIQNELQKSKPEYLIPQTKFQGMSEQQRSLSANIRYPIPPYNIIPKKDLQNKSIQLEIKEKANNWIHSQINYPSTNENQIIASSCNNVVQETQSSTPFIKNSVFYEEANTGHKYSSNAKDLSPESKNNYLRVIYEKVKFNVSNEKEKVELLDHKNGKLKTTLRVLEPASEPENSKSDSAKKVKRALSTLKSAGIILSEFSDESQLHSDGLENFEAISDHNLNSISSLKIINSNFKNKFNYLGEIMPSNMPNSSKFSKNYKSEKNSNSFYDTTDTLKFLSNSQVHNKDNQSSKEIGKISNPEYKKNNENMNYKLNHRYNSTIRLRKNSSTSIYCLNCEKILNDHKDNIQFHLNNCIEITKSLLEQTLDRLFLPKSLFEESIELKNINKKLFSLINLISHKLQILTIISSSMKNFENTKKIIGLIEMLIEKAIQIKENNIEKNKILTNIELIKESCEFINKNIDPFHSLVFVVYFEKFIYYAHNKVQYIKDKDDQKKNKILIFRNIKNKKNKPDIRNLVETNSHIKSVNQRTYSVSTEKANEIHNTLKFMSINPQNLKVVKVKQNSLKNSQFSKTFDNVNLADRFKASSFASSNHIKFTNEVSTTSNDTSNYLNHDQYDQMKKDFITLAIACKKELPLDHPGIMVLITDIFEEVLKLKIPRSDWEIFIKQKYNIHSKQIQLQVQIWLNYLQESISLKFEQHDFSIFFGQLLNSIKLTMCLFKDKAIKTRYMPKVIILFESTYFKCLKIELNSNKILLKPIFLAFVRSQQIVRFSQHIYFLQLNKIINT